MSNTIDRRAFLAGLMGTAGILATAAQARPTLPRGMDAAWRFLKKVVKGQVLLPDQAGFANLVQPNNLRDAGIPMPDIRPRQAS